MKKEIFISTLKRIKLIFCTILLTREYYKTSKKQNYHSLIKFFHSLSDEYVYTWEQDYIGKDAFFAMNVKLSTEKVENKSLLVIFKKDDTVTIKADLNCSLKIKKVSTTLDNAFRGLVKLVNMYMHPEIRKGEVHYGNITKGFPFIARKKYTTLRAGKSAFQSNGEKIDTMCPLFISLEEFILLEEELSKEHEFVETLLKEIFDSVKPKKSIKKKGGK